MFRNLFLLSLLLVLGVSTPSYSATYSDWSACNCSADSTEPKTDGIQTRTSSGTCATRPSTKDVGECERLCVCNLDTGYRINTEGLDENGNLKMDFSE